MFIMYKTNSEKYHKSDCCRKLSSLSGDVEKLTINATEDKGKTKCKICY